MEPTCPSYSRALLGALTITHVLPSQGQKLLGLIQELVLQAAARQAEWSRAGKGRGGAGKVRAWQA